MSAGEVEAAVERQARAWERGDADAVADGFAPDGVLVAPGGRWEGREAIRAEARSFLSRTRSVDVAIRRVTADGERGTVEWTWTETGHDGRTHVMEDTIELLLRDRAIARWQESFDPPAP